ncbi:MAG: hypothetical protein ACTSRK_13510 [Promethearchaeota archaeon]
MGSQKRLHLSKIIVIGLVLGSFGLGIPTYFILFYFTKDRQRMILSLIKFWGCMVNEIFITGKKLLSIGQSR